ncbi:hypothetical protein LSAT2_029740 [Lamellibrachia satsuma]|nr:hypothetical protein LSAT2_029740 [Lamellibrachia satsuma]
MTKRLAPSLRTASCKPMVFSGRPETLGATLLVGGFGTGHVYPAFKDIWIAVYVNGYIRDANPESFHACRAGYTEQCRPGIRR